MKPKYHPDKPLWSDVLGWAGVITVLTAYALVSLDYISPNGLLFQSLNIFGSIGIIIEAAYAHDKQVVILNIIWALIGLFAVLHSLI